MTKSFVDTNIFIYSLFPVDPKKHAACLALFEKAQRGDESLWTTEWVISELVWLLGRMKKSTTEIKDIIENTISTKGLEVRNLHIIQEALRIWSGKVEFIDAMNIAMCVDEEVTRGYTYDKEFDTVPRFTRLVP